MHPHPGEPDPADSRRGDELASGREPDGLDGVIEHLRKPATEGVPHVDHGRPQSCGLEQPRLRVAVRFERPVVVEMVAAQVGEDRGVESHAAHATLVERMRRNFHREHRGAVVARLGQPAMHRYGVGRGEIGAGKTARAAGAQRAEIRATPPDGVGGLGEQVRGGGLAVGAGDTRDLEVGGGAAEEPVGQLTRPCAEGRNGDTDHRRWKRRRLDTGGRFPQHGGRAALEGDCQMRKAVRASALAGEKRAAADDPAAVLRNIGHHDVAQRPRAVLEQTRESQTVVAHYRLGRHGGSLRSLDCAHHGSCACTSVVAGTRCRSSGGTASSRSAPDITAEKTGAATSPP